MTKTTTIFGTIFIALGLVFWFQTGMQAHTALIPAFFGIIVVVLARVGELKENLKKHMMHAIVTIVLLAFFGSVPGLIKLIGSFFGGELERPAAVYSQSIFAVLSATYIYLAVRSFIDARRSQES